jgi:hypothetical protein
VLVFCSVVCCSAGKAVPTATMHGAAAGAADPDYAAYFTGGVAFAQFLENARARRDEWRQHYSDATVTADLVTRMRALPDRRRILVVADDWCADSVNTIPYVARLVDAAPKRLELRIVNSTLGRPVMDAHPTPDGRGATPTIVVISGDGHLLGTLTERPAAAQVWFLEQQKTTMQQPLHEQLLKWYADDAGRTTVAELAAILER